MEAFRNVGRLFRRELRVEIGGHAILVENTWGLAALPAMLSEGLGGVKKALSDETKLFIDGKLVEKTDEFISFPCALLISTSLDVKGEVFMIEVYAKAGLFRNLLQLQVNNKRVAGDDF
jgi:hypothetical protein